MEGETQKLLNLEASCTRVIGQDEASKRSRKP
jgi:hypothetical protein